MQVVIKNEEREKVLYEKLMLMGKQYGCHQISKRSFYIFGKQFPVCARCTGGIIGNLIAYILFFIYVFPISIYMLGCAVIFSDWLIQYLGIKESTNIRRFFTGIIGGFSLTTLQCINIQRVIKLIINFFI